MSTNHLAVHKQKSRPYRVALYSHDTMGFGHIRRNLLIAHALSHSNPQADILLVCGSREGGAFALPRGADSLILPALRKGSGGAYRSRNLQISLDDLIHLRSTTIRGAIEAFEPDIFIVDNVPRGAFKELDATLESLHQHGHARCVLGLRDILDDPQTIQRQWLHEANIDAIRRLYHSVWVYGDPTLYDLVEEYNLPLDVAVKIRHVGYLDQSVRFDSTEKGNANTFDDLPLPSDRLALCVLGGGQDGADLARHFLDAQLPPGMSGILLTGPFMPKEHKQHLRQLAHARGRFRVFEFVTEASCLMERADRVIAMGGYNTVGEILSFEKNALIVPRVTPRTEQLIRAQRLKDMGLIEMIEPDALNHERLTQWLAQPISPPRVKGRLDLNGLLRLPELVGQLLNPTTTSAFTAEPTGGLQHAIG